MNYPSAAMAACLVAGHMTADFVLQTRWMIERKNRPSGLLAHGAVVGLSHLFFLTPFLNTTVAMAVGALTVAHVVIDGVKAAVAPRMHRRMLELFAVDQVLHGCTLAAAKLMLPPAGPPAAWLPWTPMQLFAAAMLASALAFNVNGMSAIVEGVLARLGVRAAPGPRVGRAIGVLERVFAVILLLQDKWGALGFLIAAKSLARFKDLDQRDRAEYYLVGTLVSLLGATVCAVLVRSLLH